jgi:hypothetical protein
MTRVKFGDSCCVLNVNVATDVSFCTALRWRGSKVYFDFANRQLVSPAYLKNFIFKERIKGGILGDEVGLGKTFEGKS